MYVDIMKPGCCAADNGGVYALQFEGYFNGKFRKDWHCAVYEEENNGKAMLF